MVSFSSIDDIESMRKEDHYEEVKDEAVASVASADSYGIAHQAEFKRRGRPPKDHLVKNDYEV